MKLKKGDNVVVIAGKDKGTEGEVVRVLPSKNKVIVNGVNRAKKHTKPNRVQQQGGIIDRDMPMRRQQRDARPQGQAHPRRLQDPGRRHQGAHRQAHAAR